MKVSIHILSSFILFLILLPFLKSWAVIPFISAILIDIDHYFYYAFTRKKLNFKNSYIFFNELRKNSKKSGAGILYILCIFHTYEFLFLIAIFSLFSEVFVLITLGVAFHLILDYIDFLTTKANYRKSKMFLHYFKIHKEERL